MTDLAEIERVFEGHGIKRGEYSPALGWQYVCKCGYTTQGWPMLSFAEMDLGEHFAATREETA